MPRVSTYINFPGNTEEAFTFYQSVFKTEYSCHIARFSEAPPNPDHPLSEADAQKILHIELPILGGYVIMGTDCLESMGMPCIPGNNVQLNLEPDTREEADYLFTSLSEGGTIEMPIQDMFWGAYFGTFTDKFGIHWMVNCAQTQTSSHT